MYCPRLKHFVRLNQDGSIGKCGHMVNAMGFKTFDELEKSKWLGGIKDVMSQDKWPEECVRCKQTEQVNGESIRTKSIERHKILQWEGYWTTYVTVLVNPVTPDSAPR